MGLTKTKQQQFDPDSVVIAWQGGSIDDVDGAPFTWSRGTRLKASHPAVVRLGRGAFVEDGVPQSEWPHVLDGVIADAEAKAPRQKPAPRIDPKTPIGDLVISTVGITASTEGAIELGTIVYESDRRVKAIPEAGWRPLAEQLGMS